MLFLDSEFPQDPHFGVLVETVFVEEIAHDDDSKSTVDETEDDGEDDEGSVPVVVGRDCRESEEHENDGFRSQREHFDEGFGGLDGAFIDVLTTVLTHGCSAKYDPGSY